MITPIWTAQHEDGVSARSGGGGGMGVGGTLCFIADRYLFRNLFSSLTLKRRYRGSNSHFWTINRPPGLLGLRDGIREVKAIFWTHPDSKG